MKTNTESTPHQVRIAAVIQTVIIPQLKERIDSSSSVNFSILKDFEAKVYDSAELLASKALLLFETGEVTNIAAYICGCLKKLYKKSASKFYDRHSRFIELDEAEGGFLAHTSDFIPLTKATEAKEIIKLARDNLSQDAKLLIDAYLELGSFNAARIHYNWNNKRISRLQKEIKMVFSAFYGGEE